jgi:predicted nuclease of restriction endonuclease-like (RecB) superfamily
VWALDEETGNLLRGEGMSERIDPSFSEVVHLIQSALQRAFQAVNTVLIDLYWQVGEYISRKIEDEVWGKAVIQQLAEHLQRTNPDLRGFSAQNLWRMRQFYEAYQETPILSALLRELPSVFWANVSVPKSENSTSASLKKALL